MTEIQCLVWLLSMPTCTNVSYSMQEFTGVSFNTSEQHKDSKQSQIKHETEDVKVTIVFEGYYNGLDIKVVRDDVMDSWIRTNCCTDLLNSCHVKFFRKYLRNIGSSLFLFPTLSKQDAL